MADLDAEPCTPDPPASQPEPGKPSAGRRSRPLAWIIGLYLLLHFGYATVTPAQNGPDEPQHFQYVRSLALYHQLPLFDGMRNDFDARPMVLHTGLHGPVYYALLAPFYLAARPLGEDAALQVLRHLTGLLGVLLILLVYAACRPLFGEGPVTWGATAAAALHPLTAYLGATVSNEMLAAVWVALAFWYLARILAGEGSVRPWLGAGIALALGLLTKYTAVVALFAAAVVLLAQWRRERLPFGQVALRATALLLPTLLLGWGWFSRNLAQHGELFVLQYDQPAFKGGMLPALLLPEESLPALFFALWQVFQTYVGPLWLFREWPALFARLWPAWVLLFLAPVAGWIGGRRRAAPAERVLYAAAAVALLANLAGVANTCLFKQWAMWVFGGRFMLVSLPGAMLLCVAGVAGWARSPKRADVPVALFCAALALQNLWLIPAVYAFYHR